MQLNTITMTIKNGQASFEGIPDNWGIHIKNYDTNMNEDTVLSTEEMEELQTYKDEDGWYHSSHFMDYVEQDEEIQTQLPIGV